MPPRWSPSHPIPALPATHWSSRASAWPLKARSREPSARSSPLNPCARATQSPCANARGCDSAAATGPVRAVCRNVPSNLDPFDAHARRLLAGSRFLAGDVVGRAARLESPIRSESRSDPHRRPRPHPLCDRGPATGSAAGPSDHPRSFPARAAAPGRSAGNDGFPPGSPIPCRTAPPRWMCPCWSGRCWRPAAGISPGPGAGP